MGTLAMRGAVTECERHGDRSDPGRLPTGRGGGNGWRELGSPGPTPAPRRHSSGIIYRPIVPSSGFSGETCLDFR
jgi:hypothetical protein